MGITAGDIKEGEEVNVEDEIMFIRELTELTLVCKDENEEVVGTTVNRPGVATYGRVKGKESEEDMSWEGKERELVNAPLFMDIILLLFVRKLLMELLLLLSWLAILLLLVLLLLLLLLLMLLLLLLLLLSVKLELACWL